MAKSFTHLLRAPESPVKLHKIASDAHPGVDSKDEALRKLPKLGARLADLQERLFAQSRGGTEPASKKLLLVLQGMDTSGKGGTVKHVAGVMDPGGLRITSFKSPTEEELSHDFLWRIRKALPTPGMVGVFDRSHYEDVLIVRVRDLVPREQWELRYGLINEFEQELADQGTTVVKCFLHIGRDTQKDRLLARLDDPTKLWKYNTNDVKERKLWPAYQDAYEAALSLTSTETAPWYVIPADRKWYRNYAITKLLIETLERIGPEWPPADYDVKTEKKRVLAS
ncbi:PPK2 family polyphosphate:nucleotide phosphotransferase [Catenulispora sp. MAP5-51]|uniref:PPK2 family polyphosphate kinase n=1 Tax=Catenulispora sp. MAP5-51 TaxID=3156298 RepID=UPI003518E3E0